MTTDSTWWRGAVVYQIYPRSFKDTNGDGIGDLKGIASQLDYVADLGVDAIWISPFFVSPMRDFGYDISDYRDVDRMFGTLDDFRELVRKAHQFGLKVLIDQVLSHTSDQHPWFVESRASRTGDKSDWYVWADPVNGGPPNNWLALFGGAAWTWNDVRQQYYLHNFLECQPDLNFHNPAVRQAQLDNIEFWLEEGVDGFRFDVVNFYFHSAGLEDNPSVDTPLNPGATKSNPYFAQRHIHDVDQPENLAFLQSVRELLERHGCATSIGEISSDRSLEIMAQYTGGGDKLHMAYTFDLLNSESSAQYIGNVIKKIESELEDGWPCWALSNHDVERSASRWGEGRDPERFPRVALAMLLSLRGSACLYQGEELGLPQARLERDQLQDPYGIEFWPDYQGRDGCRTPMPWGSDPTGRFSTGTAWLPLPAEHLALSVDAQLAAENSTLDFVRRLIQWRKEQPALVSGALEMVPAADDVLCWIRRSDNQAMLVALNLTPETRRTPLPVAGCRSLEGHGFAGRIQQGDIVLGPYDALFAELPDPGRVVS